MESTLKINMDQAPHLELLAQHKLLSGDIKALSDEELLALILAPGTRACSAKTIATRVLPQIELAGDVLNISALQSVPGVGSSKALALAAAFEFSRRRIRPEGYKITCARDIIPLLQHLVDRPQEHVITISLSGAHEVIKMRTVSIGILTSCPIHPREVFVGPICDRAYSIILAHNHPSGEPAPSTEDRTITQRLSNAGKTLGIKLLDHIIFARRGYYSFQEHGELR